MFLSNPVKILNATFILSLFFTGCSLWRRADNSSNNFELPKKSELPFATREPEVFQAVIVTSTGDIERKVSIARNGTERRVDFDPGTDTHRAVLRVSDKEYHLYFKRKAYTERELASGGSGES